MNCPSRCLSRWVRGNLSIQTCILRLHAHHLNQASPTVTLWSICFVQTSLKLVQAALFGIILLEVCLKWNMIAGQLPRRIGLYCSATGRHPNSTSKLKYPQGPKVQNEWPKRERKIRRRIGYPDKTPWPATRSTFPVAQPIPWFGFCNRISQYVYLVEASTNFLGFRSALIWTPI